MPACTCRRRPAVADRGRDDPSRRSTTLDPNGTLRSVFDQLDVFADGSDLIFSVAIAGDQLMPLGMALATQSALTVSASASIGDDGRLARAQNCS